MRKKKTKPKILYEKYLEDHKEELELQQLGEQLQTDAVVIKKMTTGAKILQLSADVLVTLLKFIGIFMVLALLSLAVTVLMNEPLREYVFGYFGIK